MRNLFYYELDKAEELRRNYYSWIEKQANARRGLKETLQAIQIKEKKSSYVERIYFKM